MARLRRLPEDPERFVGLSYEDSIYYQKALDWPYDRTMQHVCRSYELIAERALTGKTFFGAIREDD